MRSIWVVCVLLLCSTAIEARVKSGYRTGANRDCQWDAIDAHVIEQFARYGPLSKGREYFGFIYLFEGEIASAVNRGRSCNEYCNVDTGPAAARIPPGARVIGEWHTHPHSYGAERLSTADLRGAYSNRHIPCYAAYYSQPNGRIYAWDPQQSLVSLGMASRYQIGTYVAERRLGARRAE